MLEFNGIGKMLIFIGLGIAATGIVLLLIGKLPDEDSWLGWLGKLPGDFYIKRDNFSFYFPLTTSIIVSIIGSFLLYYFTKR